MTCKHAIVAMIMAAALASAAGLSRAQGNALVKVTPAPPVPALPPQAGPTPAPVGPEDAAARAARKYCTGSVSATLGEIDAFAGRHSPYEDLLNKRIAGNAPAQPIQEKRPRFPAELKRKEISGRAMVVVAISERGRAVDALVACSDHELIAGHALKQARDLRYTPALHAGKPVPSVVIVPIVFMPTSR